MVSRKILLFLLQAVAVGLAAAAVLLYLQPEKNWAPVVEITEETAPAEAVRSGIPLQGPVSYAAAVALATPAVVNIHTAKEILRPSNRILRDLFGMNLGQQPSEVESSLGSGVIISKQGYILTNHHVIAEADSIWVLLKDGRSTMATVVGTDPDTDLSVLKVELANLPTITLGSSESLRVGDVVLAIGNPYGVGQTVTMGIVSATGRNQLGINTFENFIQTDAAINPGNSGGALIDPVGRMVGINTAIFSRSGGSQGIGFAIPVSLAKEVMEQIIENGQVIRGWLGVEIQDVTPELAVAFGLNRVQGVIVTGILRNGPAALGGILPGDIITHIAGREVLDVQETLTAIVQTRPGKVIEVLVVRKEGSGRLKVRVAARPTNSRR